MPQIRVAADARALLRCGARPLRRVLDATPRNAMLPIVGGNPCPQLTSAGKWRGAKPSKAR
eukprot:11205491-Lingulodinium_polyedra.AAC.1